MAGSRCCGRDATAVSRGEAVPRCTPVYAAKVPRGFVPRGPYLRIRHASLLHGAFNGRRFDSLWISPYVIHQTERVFESTFRRVNGGCGVKAMAKYSNGHAVTSKYTPTGQCILDTLPPKAQMDAFALIEKVATMCPASERAIRGELWNLANLGAIELTWNGRVSRGQASAKA